MTGSALIYLFAAASALLSARNLFAIAALPPSPERLVFFHVPAALTAIAATLAALLASLAFLRTRNFLYDALALAATEAGLAFLAVYIATGAVWGRALSGLWWTWDAHLTSALVCWMLYAAYLMLRRSLEEPTQRAIFAAVFSVFAFLDVPFVAASMQWWRSSKAHGFPPDWSATTLLQVLAMLLLAAVFASVRFRQEESQRELDYLRRMAHTL